VKKRINASDIKCIPVLTQTGKEFDNVTMATIWCKDGSGYDALFDKHGEPLTRYQKLRQLEGFFSKSFELAELDGFEVLLSGFES
jgi:hypothetical protein